MARSGSVTSGDEDTFVVPSSWRRFVLPRHGDPGVKPWRPDPGSPVAFDAPVAPAARQLTDLLSRVGTDTSIGEAGLEHLAGNATPLGAAAVAGLTMHELRRQVEDRPRAVADRWLAEHGPAFAARAAVELNTLSQSESRGWGPWRFTRLRPGAVRFSRAVLDANASVAVHVRAALAALPGDDYAACVEALREFRAGTVGQRVGASFVAPTETAWHRDDCAEVAASADRFGAVLMLMAVRSAADVGVLRPYAGHACDLHVPYTIAAGAGPAAAPVLAGWCDSGLLGAADRRRLLSILAALPSAWTRRRWRGRRASATSGWSGRSSGSRSRAARAGRPRRSATAPGGCTPGSSRGSSGAGPTSSSGRSSAGGDRRGCRAASRGCTSSSPGSSWTRCRWCSTPPARRRPSRLRRCCPTPRRRSPSRWPAGRHGHTRCGRSRSGG